MTRLILALTACGTALVPFLSLAPAHAQSVRTWVASNGNNANPCTRALPCASFVGALPNTALNGEINCVDAGVFGLGPTLVINKSVTIDCHDVFAAMTDCATVPEIVINIPVSPSDPHRTVRLRNFTINGIGPNLQCGTTGIQIVAAAAVSIENVVIQGFNQRGIWDQRAAGGRLTITNSTLRNNGGSGLLVLPGSGSTRIDVAVDNVIAEGNHVGMAFANGAKAMVSRSLIVNNVSLGIDAENVSGGSGAQVALDNSTVSNNGTGLFTFNGGVLDVSNSNIAFNAQGAAGPWFSFGNNRVHRNTAAGTPPTAIGALTHDVGQQ
jgi:Right handed beta helix region